ncbi:MAG: hypothetical protein IT230_04505 [Flavobacteriales bacterium]|nr:hypothetical protein [Flavobacteriales bacterium]
MSLFDRSLELFDRHKYGIIGTLMVHTLLMVVLNFSILHSAPVVPEEQPILMELESPGPEPEEAQQMPPEQGGTPATPVTNLASNVTAAASPQLSPAARQRLAERVEQDLLDMEKAEFERLAQQRKAEGKEIEMPMLDPSKFDKRNYMEQAPKPIKVEGLTTVAYDLVGRAHVVLEVPAYLCKGSGKIVVRVAVDRAGAVIKAELDPAASSALTGCMAENALLSASQARFSASATAQQPQRGTITYIFLAQ